MQRKLRARKTAPGHRICAFALLTGLAALAPLDGAQAKFKLLHSFTGGSDGSNPQAKLLLVSKYYTKTLYGTTTSGGAYGHGVVFKITTYGRETVLHDFQGDFGGATDGAEPEAGLIADKSGNLYGTTFHGGDGAECYSLCGTVFKLAPDGTESVLHNFQLGGDGVGPEASLVLDKRGNLYGTTVGGGTAEGTVFKLARDGTETLLHVFNENDGAGPSSGLIADADGNLYGTTSSGHGRHIRHTGTVFRLAADGTETLLHVFAGWKNNDGGSDCKCGTVFKLAPDGTESVLHAFSGGSDGAKPYGGLLADLSGNLYGTTWAGGGDCNCGTVFRLAPDGTETVLHAFSGSDGGYPNAGLAIDKKGVLYGTTFLGGANDSGTVFKIAP